MKIKQIVDIIKEEVRTGHKKVRLGHEPYSFKFEFDCKGNYGELIVYEDRAMEYEMNGRRGKLPYDKEFYNLICQKS